MADVRTTVTEVVTALGMFGFDDVERALERRPDRLRNVDDDVWSALQDAWAAPGRRALFHAALRNGQVFLTARDALRGRCPDVVEWKGAHRAPGDEVVPADIRVDHVYFVSCKYLSRIVMNASPAHLFDRLLAGGHGRRGGDWFAEVAPDEHRALYDSVRKALAGTLPLPDDVGALRAADRRALALALRGGWPDGATPRYEALAARVAEVSACRWREAYGREPLRLLWRLLRIGSAPYFVLGASADDVLRLRIATPWDWRSRYDLCEFRVDAGGGGQPVVRWHAAVRDRETGDDVALDGHVEIRWSHGRFCGPPEAKVYLDTPHAAVPGYFPLV
jgi:hypothetical protein